ncbi:hypothetical protein VP01_3854g3, partial [Puccinia sorghi]
LQVLVLSEMNHHHKIRLAILAQQKCRLKPNSNFPIPTNTLLELWSTALSIKQPSITWIHWLFHSTLNQKHPTIQNHTQINRYLAIAIGLIIRQPDHNQHLTSCLAAIQHWQQNNNQPISIELEHRRLQILQRLALPSSPESSSSHDPYVVSTLLRSHSHRPQDVLQQLNGDQEHLLRTISVSCRSKGQLIHRTQPDGPYQPLSSAQFHQLISDNPQPSLWKTGLILSQAECLVGQIGMIIQEPPHLHSQGGAVQEILERLRELLDLSLSSDAPQEANLYGGRLEAHRLLRRQADGLETILQHLLLSPREASVDFPLVFELIEGALERRGPDMVRPRTWKLLLSSHLKLSTQWSGNAGLERLFHLATLWATRILVEQNPHEACTPIQFKKLMPGDMGLTMIERVLFPTDEEHSKGKQPASSSDQQQQQQQQQHDGDGDEFERLVARIHTMNRFLHSLGSPRRFRDRRLMRLIFLSVQKRHNPSRNLSLEQHLDNPQYQQPWSFVGLDWWNRTDVWRELEFRLSPSSLPVLPAQPPPQSQEVEEKAEELVELFRDKLR